MDITGDESSSAHGGVFSLHWLEIVLITCVVLWPLCTVLLWGVERLAEQDDRRRIRQLEERPANYHEMTEV